MFTSVIVFGPVRIPYHDREKKKRGTWCRRNGNQPTTCPPSKTQLRTAVVFVTGSAAFALPISDSPGECGPEIGYTPEAPSSSLRPGLARLAFVFVIWYQ